MQKYNRVKNLSSTLFKRLTGVNKAVFNEMIFVLNKAEKNKKILGGKPSALSTEDKVLMTLEYLREYRTYFHLGKSYGISESACYRNCKWVEGVLINDKRFSLPGKKILLQDNSTIEVILIDATETTIERPKKKGETQKANQKQE